MLDKNECRCWTFTFGIGHPLFAGMYLDIYGTVNGTREIMEKVFGKNWGFQYKSHEEAGVERFSLVKIPTKSIAY